MFQITGTVNMAESVSPNAKILNNSPANVGIVPQAHATDAVITVIVALTNTFTIQLMLNPNTG